GESPACPERLEPDRSTGRDAVAEAGDAHGDHRARMGPVVSGATHSANHREGGRQASAAWRQGDAMSRHAGPPRGADAPTVPEPTFAERARTLAYLGRTGTLATLSRRHPGHPFGSVMPYALDDGGRPLFLISTMAVRRGPRMNPRSQRSPDNGFMSTTLIDAQSSELDRAKRLKLVWEIQKKVEADVARPMLGWRKEYFVARMQEVWLDK